MKTLLGTYSVGIALSLSTAVSHATPNAARLQEISQVASQYDEQNLVNNVIIVPRSDLKGPAFSQQLQSGGFIIQYNPQIVDSLPQSGKSFIFYHELGHIRLGHVAMDYPGPERATEFEFEADAFASFVYKNIKGGMDSGLKEFFQILATKTQTLPPGPQRVKFCEEIFSQ